ncbi:Hsp20/alpha crystallin family protein [Thermoflavimicrobium dichotomicum]|uniref:HSP20 family protein n=1 Tax=Thermoflavimicrobium dichotomicum TaxID=46223 RepID=A0A1I3JBV5_9BACL|nr:Hsp20/alpha crystallin family protein [Thermoflavimicrobium dichotomicum]SFI57620.1 HSP20 family protein [Thermoflavimicrobium dichotomicum]
MSKLWDGMERWNQLARMFLGDDFFEEMISVKNNTTLPNADVYHTKTEVIAVIDLPGIEDIKSIDVQIEGDKLVIKGAVTSPYQAYQVLLNERMKGSFQKVIPLGTMVSNKQPFARYRKGVLEIRIPKLKSDTKQKIKIHE